MEASDNLGAAECTAVKISVTSIASSLVLHSPPLMGIHRHWRHWMVCGFVMTLWPVEWKISGFMLYRTYIYNKNLNYIVLGKLAGKTVCVSDMQDTACYHWMLIVQLDADSMWQVTKTGLPAKFNSVVCYNYSVCCMLIFKNCDFFHVSTGLHFLALEWKELGQKPAATFTTSIREFKVM